MRIQRATAPIGITVSSDLKRGHIDPMGGRREPNKRDIELMQHVMAGRSNIAIAHFMFVSHKTVKNRLSDLFVMFHAQSRTDLVIRAIRGGYIPCPCRCNCAKGRVQRLPRPAIRPMRRRRI